MTRLRRDAHDTQLAAPAQRPLRIIASGTLFVTHTLSLPSHPSPSTMVRAQSVSKTRGGSASTLLSLLAQFSCVDALLVAPLGGNDEGSMILRDLENEGVVTRYCKIWKSAGVPSAWVLHSADTNTRTVINHNPLPDITHEEFVSLLGPLLAPENYLCPSPSASPTVGPTPPGSPPRSQTSLRFNPHSPAPFDWLHFEGRSVKTTLSNMTGLDGLARERKWRSHCVFSVDVGRKGRQGVEALIPHADILFLNKHYAQVHSPEYASTPRAFLLSLASIAPPHALLVAHWGSEGAAVLSLPTKEYFQSSGWVEERPTGGERGRKTERGGEIESVRSGSEFWAGYRSRTPSSSEFTTGGHSGMRRESYEEEDNDSQGTEVPDDDGEGGVMDEVGGQDAFVGGMIYALSRRIAPGTPYTPSSGGEREKAVNQGKWRLEECLRFATELSGRKMRRRDWDGLADEMIDWLT